MARLPHPVPEPLAESIAAHLRAIADPTRIRILDQLRQRPSTVGELTKLLGAGQQNVSKHLGVLRAAGVVEREKEGNRVRYWIADERALELCEKVSEGLSS